MTCLTWVTHTEYLLETFFSEILSQYRTVYCNRQPNCRHSFAWNGFYFSPGPYFGQRSKILVYVSLQKSPIESLLYYKFHKMEIKQTALYIFILASDKLISKLVILSYNDKKSNDQLVSPLELYGSINVQLIKQLFSKNTFVYNLHTSLSKILCYNKLSPEAIFNILCFVVIIFKSNTQWVRFDTSENVLFLLCSCKLLFSQWWPPFPNGQCHLIPFNNFHWSVFMRRVMAKSDGGSLMQS